MPPSSLTEFGVIYFGNDWSAENRTSSHHIAERLAARTSVLYVDSPGLREVCRAEGPALAADLLIASDGPRIEASRPTMFLGSRGGYTFELSLNLR